MAGNKKALSRKDAVRADKADTNSEEAINLVCNLSDLVEERGIEKGIKQGIKQGREEGR